MVYKLYHYWCYFKYSEAYVVGEDEQDIGRGYGLMEIRRGLRGRAANLAFKRREDGAGLLAPLLEARTPRPLQFLGPGEGSSG